MDIDLSSEFEILKEAELAYEQDRLSVAVEMLEPLAMKGSAQACQFLGFIYRTENNTKESRALARQWYERYVFALKAVAGTGDQCAQFELAKLFQFGEHVAKDEKLAYSIFSQLADAENSEAEFSLFTFYLYGWCGCLKHDGKAFYWLKRAADHGHAEGMFQLGMRLLANSNRDEGLRWVQLAANQGFWPAADYLKKSENGS